MTKTDIEMERKGVSPVIATVILIAIVVVLAAIIFLWARGFVSEKIVKDGRAVELSCGDINFEAGVFNSGTTKELDVINRGNIPLYGVDVKVISTGETSVTRWDRTIGIGDSESKTFSALGISASDGDKLNVVPVILGESGTGKVVHVCDDQYGYFVEV
jgi:flagellin-like protein